VSLCHGVLGARKSKATRRNSRSISRVINKGFMVPVYLGTVYLGVSNGNNTPRSFGQGVTTEKHLLLITVLITCGSESRDGHLNLITRANPNSMDAWYAFHKVGRLRYLTKYTGTESQREFPYGGTGIASIFTSIITYHRTSLCYISISCVGSPIAVRCQRKAISALYECQRQ